ncbi:hypothetical protein Pth03_62010 [Planotetraspora thailandica]|uniref:DUF4386 domain-containing protein n=1 Tax=Planotetraspora thailandica TaxID=487172 RepID=A0A8J3V5L9_9ACTN|nr:hypothetical protein [Planotetraspora thailandica]GII57812.1 hypothetical protein Pth03_62010 [Planotetraspora thailandica]
MIRKVLAGCLVAAPVLFTATEFTRLLVESRDESGSPEGTLTAIAEARGVWEIFGWLVVVTAPAWLAAMLGLVEGLRQIRERWAFITGAVAVIGALGWAMHQAAYVELNAIAAHHRPAGDLALSILDGAGGTGMEDATLIVMVVGQLLGPLLVVLGYARAGVVPWWAFACVPAWLIVTMFAGSLSPTLSLANLLLLPPFVMVARLLVSPVHRADQVGSPSAVTG